LRQLFLLTHKTLRLHYDAPVPVKRNGRWVNAVPSDWKARTSVTVKPGMSPGERARRAGTLESMLNKQLAMAEQGLDDVLVNVEGFYQALMDWARALDVPNPEQYWVDPSSPEALKEIKRKAKRAQEQAASQQRLIDVALDLENTKIALKKYSGDQKTQFDYWNAVLGAEIEEATLTGKGMVDILAAKVQAAQAERGAKNGRGLEPRGSAAQE
jgi:hypothetical protein